MIFLANIVKMLTQCWLNLYPAKLSYSNYQPLENVSRYRDPQPQVVEINAYLFNLKPNM